MKKIIQITPTFWVVQSSLFSTNSGISINSKKACLIDPCVSPSEIASISDFVKEKEAYPESIILTHCHWDHILGPEHFPKAKIIAHENYLSESTGLMGKYILQCIDNFELENNYKRENQFCIPVPDRTFQDTTTFIVGDISIQLLHAPGHSSDQIIIYIPNSSILWAGDMLSDLEIPLIIYSLIAYENSLVMLSDLDINILIPGHGQHTNDLKEISIRLKEDLEYVLEIRDKVSCAVNQGWKVKQTVDSCAKMRYRNPEGNQHSHRMNIESAYIELGGEADSTKVGWDQELTK